MTGRTKAIKVATIVAGIIASLTLPAYSQGMKKGSHAAPSTETKPKVDGRTSLQHAQNPPIAAALHERVPEEGWLASTHSQLYQPCRRL